MTRKILALAALTAIIVAAGTFAATNAGGFSTRTEPTALERVIARLAHRLAVPREARSAVNPVPYSAEVWTEARAHFADHCASCHANDGSGRTTLGQSLYPKSPDMRLTATQVLSDGELYWIIKNGVRLTGMPAWGEVGSDDADTWKLVHFIRRLNELTPEQLKEMEALNPRSRSEFEEEREDEQFLAGQGEDKEKTR